MSSAVAEFSEMEEAVTSHVVSLRTDLLQELASVSCRLEEEHSFVQLDFTFSLRSDQTLHRHVVKMGSLSLTKPRQRLQYLEAAFKFLRQIVDEAIAKSSPPAPASISDPVGRP